MTTEYYEMGRTREWSHERSGSGLHLVTPAADAIDDPDDFAEFSTMYHKAFPGFHWECIDISSTNYWLSQLIPVDITGISTTSASSQKFVLPTSAQITKAWFGGGQYCRYQYYLQTTNDGDHYWEIKLNNHSTLVHGIDTSADSINTWYQKAEDLSDLVTINDGANESGLQIGYTKVDSPGRLTLSVHYEYRVVLDHGALV